MSHRVRISLVFIALLLASACHAQSVNRVSILFDSFGKDRALTMDWGFAPLVEYRGKRMLFDTGGDPDILAHTAAAKNIDLSKLDFVVMWHGHGDHMGGLAYVLKVNPHVNIYMRRKRDPESMATIRPAAPGTARTRLCLQSSVITAGRHPKSYTWERRGRAPTFS